MIHGVQEKMLTHIHHLCFSSLLFAVSLMVAMGTSSGAEQSAVMACCDHGAALLSHASSCLCSFLLPASAALQGLHRNPQTCRSLTCDMCA